MLARNLGESTGAVRATLDGAVGVTLRAAAAKSAGDAGAEEVLSVLRDSQAAGAGLLAGSPPGFEERLRRADPRDPLATSTAAVDRLFSGRAPGLVDHLASFARVKKESAAALLRLGASLTLAALNDAGAVAQGSAGLRRLLRGQDVARILPRGFEPDVGAPALTRAENRRLPWALLAATLLVATVLGLRSCDRNEPGAIVETVAPPGQTLTIEPVEPLQLERGRR
jgi:hypothetical protein